MRQLCPIPRSRPCPGASGSSSAAFVANLPAASRWSRCGTPPEALHGMTANSFTSVSLTPPLVLVCVDRSALILEHFRSIPYFGINILSASQRPLSDQFAGRGYDRFQGVAWYAGQTGVPLLPDVLATIECSRWEVMTAGDHDIVIGEVLHANCQDGDPLVFYCSQYRSLG